VHASGGNRFRATIHYDGSAFAGWQIQPDVRTVQGDIEAALGRLEIGARVTAAGRTDAGVHGAGQEIAFDAPLRWTAAELGRALDSILGREIWIERLSEAAPDFHPRFQATARRYEYYVSVGPAGRAPYRRHGTGWISRHPDTELLTEATRAILGQHDFAGFSKSGQPEVSTVCTVEEASWTVTVLGDLRLRIVADRFVHRMVRYLVTTTLEQGLEERSAEDVSRILSGSSGVRPPAPADAAGLYLTGVRFPEGWNRPEGVPGLWPGRADSGGSA
jgi:tRNA pseudouridine38-40 synthase